MSAVQSASDYLFRREPVPPPSNVVPQADPQRGRALNRGPVAAGLEPYVPGPGEPWATDRKRAAHLLRRTGFGSSAAAINALLAKASPAQAVADLVQEAIDLPIPGQPSWYLEPDPDYDQQEDRRNDLINDWVSRMFGDGLREKLALFWSNHFVTHYDSYFWAEYSYQYLTTAEDVCAG